MARRDLIAIVEATYDLAASETQWLQGVADSLQGVLQADDGVLAYHVDVDDEGHRIRNAVHSGESSMNMVAQIESMAALLNKRRRGEAGLLERVKAKLYDGVLRQGFRSSADRVLQSEFGRVGPNWMYTLGAPIEDVFALLNQHIDHHGMTGFFGGLTTKRVFRPAERAMYQMLSAHIKAGLRLRRRMPATPSVQAPEGGAVLSAAGKVLHADGDARDDSARTELCERAGQIDAARTQRSGRDEDALAVWHGLIDGRWSLVEQFDADGKRFMLAHRNPEDVRDPRGLSMMEVRVVGLAVRGYSDKLIAYHLGIAEGTVSSHLTHAMTKLRISNRVALVRQLGSRFPQSDV
jgi:DNA-binding CsgD family transcriptional regulator